MIGIQAVTSQLLQATPQQRSNSVVLKRESYVQFIFHLKYYLKTGIMQFGSL